MVQIVTDSSVLYTEEEAKAAGFDVVPLCVSVGDMDGRDLQINMEAVLPGKIKASGIVQVQGSIIKNRDPLYLFRSISGGSRGIWF